VLLRLGRDVDAVVPRARQELVRAGGASGATSRRDLAAGGGRAGRQAGGRGGAGAGGRGGGAGRGGVGGVAGHLTVAGAVAVVAAVAAGREEEREGDRRARGTPGHVQP